MDAFARSINSEIFADEEERQAVLNDIRAYRACCRQIYAVLLLSQAAGGRIESVAASAEAEEVLRVVPESDRAKVVALAALQRGDIEKGERVRGEGQPFTVRGGAALAYEMRDYFLHELWPGAMSFVWDAARRDVMTVWTSKDPEFTRANRGWLALQGARGIAQFNWRGIGFPQATGRPKLDGHGLRLKWHHERGEMYFALPRLDGGRYRVWKALRDGEEGWNLGTLWLNERDGALKVAISYHRPGTEAQVDPARICRVKIGEPGEFFLNIAGPDGATTFDTISGVEAVGLLRRMFTRKQELERRRAACGNPRAPWGHRKGWRAAQDVLSRLTVERERCVADTNHAWTRRIVTRAIAWRCGTIVVEGFPAEAELAGLPWKWSQWRDYLSYKASECGIVATYEQ